MMRRVLGWLRRVDDNDYLDGNGDEESNDDKGGGMGYSSRLVMLLRRFSGVLPRTGNDDGGGCLER
jgi:hypothetical protein